jgi:hypothetical protein
MLGSCLPDNEPQQPEHTGQAADQVERSHRRIGVRRRAQSSVGLRKRNQRGISIDSAVASVDDGAPRPNRIENAGLGGGAREDERAAHPHPAGPVERHSS